MTDTKAGSPYRRPKTALEAVVEELRRRMLQGTLPPAARLNQDELAQELGVSRVPVREAMRLLEGEGRVRYVPQKGYFVSEIDFEMIGEIYRIREILEAEAAIRTLADLPPGLVAEMQETNELIRRTGDAHELTAANRRFHFLLIRPSNMPTMTKMLESLWDTTDPYRSVYFTDPGKRRITAEQHDGIIQAVESGKVDQVVTLLNHHRRNAIEGLEGLVSASRTGATPPGAIARP